MEKRAGICHSPCSSSGQHLCIYIIGPRMGVQALPKFCYYKQRCNEFPVPFLSSPKWYKFLKMESLGQRALNNLTVLCQQVRAPGSLGAFKNSCEWSPVDSRDLASSLSQGGSKWDTELGKWKERVSFPPRLCDPHSHAGALPNPLRRQQTLSSERLSHRLQLPSKQQLSYGPSLG